MSGEVDGKKILIGNLKFLAENSVDCAELKSPAEELKNDGATVIFIVIDQKASMSLSSVSVIANSLRLKRMN